MNGERLNELKAIFEKVDADKAAVVSPLLPQVVFIEERLEALRAVPHIRFHPKNPARQEITAAGKQYKELMQSYNNTIKVLLMVLYRTENNAADELLQKLKEFE